MSFPALLLVLALAPSDGPATEVGRYVLHLVDGRVVRVEARAEPGGWSVRTGSTWSLIANDDVVRATPQRVIDEQLAALRKGSASGDPVRVEVARAALREGQVEACVRELDAVLARDPDQPAARAFVAEAPLALTLPGTLDRTTEARLVLFGARAKPAYRELASARLATLPRDAVLTELARSLASPSPNVRAFAAFALRRIDPRAGADALVRRCVVDPSARVRAESALALRDARDESLALRVAMGLEVPHSGLRTAAAEALGEMGHAVALPALVARLSALQSSGGHPGGTRGNLRVGNQIAYAKDFNVEIAQGAAIGDPIVDVVEEGTVLDARVGGTSIVSVQDQRRALCRAMQRITGVELPLDAGRWLAWWQQQQRATPAPTTPEPTVKR